MDVLRSGTEAFSRVLKCLARNGANNEAALIRRCVCATQALANNRKNRPMFLQTLFETLLAKGVFTKDELLVWANDDDVMAAGRGRALGQLEEFFEGLTA